MDMTDLSGQYLGRYYLSERLGEGGMAVVYKAYDIRLERDVAIKIIRSGAFPMDALGEVLKRFEREAKSLAKLSHPNIVKVHDFGEHEGSPYLVMEYLPGGTLRRLLEKPIPWQDAIRVILPIARGVAYAHQRGILHRDIKPANILITESGEPMLSDFGIAKLFEEEQTTALTGSGMAIGTPEYMAPEQWGGKTSPQSDLYSLGIVLYEMVAGRKPYVADTPAAILIKQAMEPLPSPRKFASDLPEEVEFVLIKALAKNPEDRYQSMTEMVNVFENLQSDSGRQSVIGTRPIEEKQKREVAEKSRLEKAERQTARKTALTKTLSKYFTALKSTSPKAKPFLRMVGLIGVIVALLVFLSIKVWPESIAVVPLVFSGISDDGEVNVYLYDAENKTVSPVDADGGKNWDPAIGTSGNIYFTSNRDGKAEIYRLINGKIEPVTDTPGQFESWGPALSVSGNIYFTSNREDGKAEIYRLTNGNTERVTDTPGQFESWAPVLRGQDIYFTSNRSKKDEVYLLKSPVINIADMISWTNILNEKFPNY